MPPKPRLLRITTVPISLKLLLHGQLSYMQQQGFEVLAVSAGGSEANDLISEGIPHVVVPMTRKITPFQDVYCLWKIIRVMQKYKPDIVHTHTPKAGLLGMLAAWLCRVPARLHTVAGLPLMEARGIKQRVLQLTEHLTYACATMVYPNSKGLMDFIRSSFNIQHSKFRMIARGSSNGIDTKHFSRSPELMQTAKEIRQRYAVPEETIVFSFVGRVVKDKGIVELIHALKQLATTSEVRLMLVGSFEQELDPLPADVMQFIESAHWVIKAGFQKDVRPWLLASDIFVFPSYREGFPNVVMQAACLEVPCIVSDINGCNEIIEDKVSGLLIPPKDEQALYEAMSFLSNHAELRSTYAHHARHFVTTHYDQQYVWQEILREYAKHSKFKIQDSKPTV